jgi:hypothetical protein
MACKPTVDWKLAPNGSSISLEGTCEGTCDAADGGGDCAPEWTLTQNGKGKNKNAKITASAAGGNKGSLNVSAKGGDVDAGEAVFSCKCGKNSTSVTVSFTLTKSTDIEDVADALISLVRFVVPLVPK